MTNRMLRVRELLKREIGQDLQREYDFPGVLVSVHDVDITPDLKDARVFIGVIGDEAAARAVVDKLNGLHGPIQNRIARRVVLRSTPRLSFELDDSIERGVQVVDLLDSIEIPDDLSDGESPAGQP